MEHYQWIFSGIGVLVLSLLLRWIARRRSSSQPPAAIVPEPKVAKNLKPFRTVKRIALGEFADIEIPLRNIGLHLVEIRMEKRKYSAVEEPVAVVNVRHHAMFPGNNVQVLEDGFRFVLPRGVSEIQDSLFAFSVEGEYYWYFIRARVLHINHHAGWIDVDFAGFHARN